MRVNVADIKLEPGSHKTVPVEVQLEAVDISGQPVQFERPFTGQAEIWNAGDRLLVRASVEGEALVSCSRCLTPFKYPLDLSFEEEFVEGREEDAAEDEEEVGRNVSYYEGDEIDLSESLRDNILLELPMKPLCTETCKGLCPTCGTNLNEGACTCVETSSVDPRLAVLKDLLRKPDSNS